MTESKAFAIAFASGGAFVLALLGTLWVSVHLALGLDWWPALVASVIVAGAFQQATFEEPPASEAAYMGAARTGGMAAAALFVFACRVILAVAAVETMRGPL